jgi:hypothetical protein
MCFFAIFAISRGRSHSFRDSKWLKHPFGSPFGIVSIGFPTRLSERLHSSVFVNRLPAGVTYSVH